MIFPPFIKLNVADFVADVLFKGRTELTEIEALEKRFLEVANKVSEMNKTETEGKTGQQKTTTDEGSGVKYSIADSFSDEFDKAISNDKYYENNAVVVGKMPSLYAKYGFNTKPNKRFRAT